jgi:hypothetical protein
MRAPLVFDSQHVRQTREWAAEVVTEASTHCLRLLSDYRARVAEHHTDVAKRRPDVFWMLEPTRIRFVATLNGCWVFATPATEDLVEIDEQWEHPVLASPDLQNAPRPVDLVRRVSGLPESEWLHLERVEVQNRPAPVSSLFADRHFPGELTTGERLADGDSDLVDIENTIRSTLGRGYDQQLLTTVGERFTDVEAISDPNTRGLALEGWIVDLLTAHRCDAEKGKHIPGEQVDVLVHRPFRALIECRWRGEPTGVDAISLLGGKLRRERPPIVIGIHVSMSGFTSEACDEVRREASERTILLFDRADVLALAAGELHVADLVESRIDEVVRRYAT